MPKAPGSAATQIHPVILCGGSGTRLWPSSRKSHPKQFVTLLGKESLFQSTLRRLSAPIFTRPIIVTNDSYRFLAAEQARDMGLYDPWIVLEPVARDTAAAVLTATLLMEDEPEALILVAPSDHIILTPELFVAAVSAGAAVARAGHIVTFGIRPDCPETGFGYLEVASEPVNGVPAEVVAFIEKPDAARAGALFASGRHLWNAGMFLFRVRDMLDAFARHAPDLVAPCRRAIDGATEDLGFQRLDEHAYGSARAISIDYAIMEKQKGVWAVPFDAGWSDLGSWKALWKTQASGGNGVVTMGNATSHGCERTLLRSEDSDVHVLGVGLSDIVAVATRDAVLIANMEKDQDIKEAVAVLRSAGVHQADTYPRFHRPWGWYETLCLDKRFQVKRIMVRPGGVLSLQSHLHRAEHWIVVAGTAKVTVNGAAQILSENQSAYVPFGSIHRLENPGTIAMYLIEVQTGNYLGEDDIIRHEDVYHRN